LETIETTMKKFEGSVLEDFVGHGAFDGKVAKDDVDGRAYTKILKVL
jgi:hypothetical protein